MLLRQPALALAGIIIYQQRCCAGVPADAKSFAQLDSHARILRDIADVSGFHSMLGNEPELPANASVTYRSAPRLSGFAADGLQERIPRQGNSQSKEQLVGGIQNELLQKVNNFVLHCFSAE